MKLHDLGTSGANVTQSIVTLPNDMYWVDEHKWTAAVSKPTYSLTGALIIETAAKLQGRPITLDPKDDMAWMSRADVSTLLGWASTPKRRFKLELEYPNDTRVFYVAFRHEVTALEAMPVKDFPQHAVDDWFKVTLRFVEVGA